MCPRKGCSQCDTVVHVKRSVCDCCHAFASKPEKEARCTTVGEPENTLKRRKTLLSEEELLVTKGRQSPQSLDQSLDSLGSCVGLALSVNIVEIPNLKEVARGLAS